MVGNQWIKIITHLNAWNPNSCKSILLGFVHIYLSQRSQHFWKHFFNIQQVKLCEHCLTNHVEGLNNKNNNNILRHTITNIFEMFILLFILFHIHGVTKLDTMPLFKFFHHFRIKESLIGAANTLIHRLTASDCCSGKNYIHNIIPIKSHLNKWNKKIIYLFNNE